MNTNKFNGVGNFAIAMITGLALAWSAQGASFDCAKAVTKIEKMICNNSNVSRVDEDVDLAYLRALERTDNRQKVIQDQRSWIKTVRNACPDADCLFKAYAIREVKLNEISTHKCYWLEPPIKDATGKRPPVEPICRVMEENFNQFCNQAPMVCELKIAPQFSQQITLPAWTSLDPVANRTLIEEFLRAPYAHSRKKNADAVWAEEQPLLDSAFAKKRITFAQAQLDLYNLGKAQTVYRLDYGNCRADNPQLSNPEQWGLAIHYPEIKTQYAPDITRPLFKEYFSMDIHLDEVFLYEGKVYDYVMGGVENPATGLGENQLVINRHEREDIAGSSPATLLKKNVCIFNYQPLREVTK